MEIDPDGENYLATGDVNGIVKIWNIENYCKNLHLRKSKAIDINPRNYKFHYHYFINTRMITLLLAPLVATIKAHVDVINSIAFCHLDDSILVITGSADCSVALHNILGVKIGVFGQLDLWKIKPVNQLIELMQEFKDNKEENNETKRDEKSWVEKSSDLDTKKKTDSENPFDIPGFTTSADFGLVKKLNSNLKLEDTYTFDKEAFVKNPSLRYNPWSKTLLGIFIQESFLLFNYLSQVN
jgi:WD40 repeat protein